MLLSSYCVVAIIVPFTGSRVHASRVQANEEEEEQALPPLPSPPQPHVPSLEALGRLSSKVD